MIYLSYLICNLAVLRARLKGWPRTPAPFSLGRWGTLITALGILYGGTMLLNIAWPRAATNPTPNETGKLLNFHWNWLNDRPVFWTVVIVTALVGAVYFLLVQRRKPVYLQAPEGEVFADEACGGFRRLLVRADARAVVIGGGVGGAAILYWLARLGWDDVVLVERADLTSGSTFHSAGLVGQLRGSLSLTKMMMSSVELYRALEDEVGLETGWREVGSLRLASSEERMEELARQAGWAKTFGLPLDLISADEAQRALPADVDRRRPRRRVPPDRRLHRPEPADVRARGGRETPAARRSTRSTRVTGIGVERGRVTGVQTDKGSIATEIVVNAGGMFAAEIGAMAGVNVPIVPMAHEYLITRPSGLPLDLPTMRDPSLLVYFRGESGGLVMGGYERNPAPWGLDGIPADFNGKLLAEDWDRVRGADAERDRARARARRCRGRPADQRARGVHARRRVHPRPDRRARVLGRGRASAPTGSPAPAAWGKLVAEWIVEGRAEPRRRGRWTRAVSAATTQPRTTRSPARSRSTRRTTTSSTRGTSARPGRPLHVSPTYPRLQELGAAFGEKSGWERPNWFEPNAAARRRVAATARLGRAALVAGDRRRAPGHARDRGALRRDVASPRSRSRARARPTSSSTCATTASPATSARSPTRDAERARRDRVRLHGHAARRGRFRIVTGTAFGRHDLAWIRSHAPEDGSVRGRGRHVAPTPASASGARGRGRSCSRSRPPTSRTRRSAYMRAREIAVGAGAVPRAPGHVRRRARLGALLPDGVRPASLGRDLGRPDRSTASSRAATGRSTRAGSRRATASGARTSRPTTRRTRRASASRSSSTRATSSAATRSLDARPARAPARLPRPRRPACGRARLGARAASTGGSWGGSRAAATATRSSARSPTPTSLPTTPSRASRSRSRSSASGSSRRGRRRAALRPRGRVRS